MMQNIEYYIGQIDNFLLKKLSETERHDFLEALKQYPNLKDELALRQLEFETAEELIAIDIRNQFSNLDTQNSRASIKSKNHTTRNLILISIVLLIVLGIIYFYYNTVQDSIDNKSGHQKEYPTQSPSINTEISDSNIAPIPTDSIKITKPPIIAKKESEDKKSNIKLIDQKINNKKNLLLASMLYKDPVIDVLRSDKSLQNDPFYKANNAWSTNNINIAYLELKKLDTNDKRYTYAELLMGHASFKLNRFQQAENHFKYVIKTNKMPYIEEAEWNLLLTQLAIGKSKSTEFQKLLTRLLKDTGHTYHDEAEKLSKELF